MIKPSTASSPIASLSKPLSVGDGVLNGALGVFGVHIPPEARPNITLESSSTVVPRRLAAFWAYCGLAN